MEPETANPNAHVSEWKRLWEQQQADNDAEVRNEKYPVHAKVQVWAREHYHDTPYFVKSICPTASKQCTSRSQGLSVPGPFIKAHFRELQQEVTLQNGDGKAWKVSFRCAQKYPFWKVGWPLFSRDNNLQPGDNTVFALVANSQFLFTVFDKHGIMKKSLAPVMKNRNIPNSSKTRSVEEEEDSDDHRSLAALPIKRKHSRTSSAPVEMKVEEYAESDVKVVEKSDIEEPEAEEEAGLKVINPPAEGKHDKRGVYNRSSELGKDCRNASSEIREHPCKLRPFMSIDPQAERRAATKSSIKTTHLNKETGTLFHEIPAICCRINVEDQDDRVSNHGKRAEKRSDDIVMNGAQRRLGRTRGNHGDMDYPPHRAGSKVFVVERLRPVTRSAAVGQQKRAGQQSSQKVKRSHVELRFSKGATHTAETKEDDHSKRDQNNFLLAKDHGMLQVTKVKLDWNQESSPIYHYFRSKRRIPSRLEKHSAAQAAATYALSLRALNFVMTMAESQVYTNFELMIPQTFVKESSLPAAGTALTLVDCTGESWEVQSHSSFLANGDPVIAIHSRDWCVFAVHHFLEEGDVCVFELTDPECFTILVRIFRVVDIPKRPGRLFEDHYNIQEVGS